MKKLFIILYLLASTTNASANPCLDRREMNTYIIASNDQIDVYTQGVSVTIRTSGCRRPLIGEYRLNYQSQSNDLYAVCVGDRVVILVNTMTYSQCRILSIQAK